jgi:hypothetical protein
MGLFKVRGADPQRSERLIRIRESIAASFRFEEDAMSGPLNASTLKRLYNMESLWVIDRGGAKKLGSANYNRELRIFSDLRSKYGSLESVVINGDGMRYHVVEKDGRVYAFSTPLELSASDLSIMLAEIEASLEPKKILVSSNSNLHNADMAVSFG